MNVVGRNFGTATELYTRLKREATKVGLVVNVSKTKYMLVEEGHTFEVVEEFVYLGSLQTAVKSEDA